MVALSWDSDLDAWSTKLSNDTFDDLEIRVVTDGEDSPPTERQLQAVAQIAALTKADLAALDTLARVYAEANLDADELEEMEQAALEFHSAVVPRLRDSADTYVLFAAESEIDIEHGAGCICKNGKHFAMIDADCIYEDYDWDANDEFDELLFDD